MWFYLSYPWMFLLNLCQGEMRESFILQFNTGFIFKNSVLWGINQNMQKNYGLWLPGRLLTSAEQIFIFPMNKINFGSCFPPGKENITK